MAIIKRKDIIEVDAIKKDLQAINAEIDKLSKSMTKLHTAKRSLNDESTGSNAKKAVDLTKQLETATNKLAAAQTKEGKKLAELRLQTQEANKANKEAAKNTLKLVSAHDKLSKKTNEAQKRFKDLATQYGVTSKQAIKARNAFEKLDNKLRRVNNAARDGRRDVGRYGLALKNTGRQLLGAAGLVGGVTALVGGVKNSIKIFKTFDKSASKLASILGKTKDQITSLTKQAKELGSTTAFTASEVVSLQTELAKLGFTTEQIEASTEGILALAAATGHDLAVSAEIAGATLRIFNLDASEMSRVTDVLAKSTTISSLSMEKLATIMPTVGKTAQIAGVSLERTAALAGTLTDRGLDASTAGTALRNIFLKLAKDGRTWEGAMAEMNSSTDKLKTSIELFGVRSSAAGIIISETAESTDNLTTSLENATGAAQEMANVMLDNLSGDMVKAQSAWEGFILSLEDGNGVISKVLRNATQWFTNLFDALKKVNEGENLYVQKLKKDSGFVEQVNKRWKEYVRQIRLANSEEEEAIIISTKKTKIQQKLRGIQYKLNKGIENGSKLSSRRRAELEFEVAFYEELKTRLVDYNKPAEKTNEIIEDNTEIVKENTKSIKGRNKELDKTANALGNIRDRQRELENQGTLSDTLGTGSQVRSRGITVDEAQIKIPGFDPLESAVDLTNKINEATATAQEAANLKELKRLQDFEDAKLAIKETALSAGVDFAKTIFADSQDEKLARLKEENEAEKDILKDKLDKGLINEIDYKRKIADLNKKERIAEGKAEKRKAIFDIAIATAVAAVKALPNLIKSGAILTIGAIQAAAIAARPIPGFKDGVIGYQGKGTETSDSNPVMISNKESVITAQGTANAPLALDAINRGLITDADINSGMSKKQNDGLKASLLMQGNKINSQILAALMNGGFSSETNDFYIINRNDGSTTKIPKG